MLYGEKKIAHMQRFLRKSKKKDCDKTERKEETRAYRRNKKYRDPDCENTEISPNGIHHEKSSFWSNHNGYHYRYGITVKWMKAKYKRENFPVHPKFDTETHRALAGIRYAKGLGFNITYGITDERINPFAYSYTQTIFPPNIQEIFDKAWSRLSPSHQIILMDCIVRILRREGLFENQEEMVKKGLLWDSSNTSLIPGYLCYQKPRVHDTSVYFDPGGHNFSAFLKGQFSWTITKKTIQYKNAKGNLVSVNRVPTNICSVKDHRIVTEHYSQKFRYNLLSSFNQIAYILEQVIDNGGRDYYQDSPLYRAISRIHPKAKSFNLELE